jgi:hypothetical protein
MLLLLLHHHHPFFVIGSDQKWARLDVLNLNFLLKFDSPVVVVGDGLLLHKAADGKWAGSRVQLVEVAGNCKS